MDQAYIPAIITASVAFIVGVGAQFLSNWLTSRREKKKYYREVYENFISKFLMDVLLYFDTHTSPRKMHDVEQEINISNVISNMEAIIHYGNNKLQSSFLEYKTRNHFYDPVGNLKERVELKICFYFLIYTVHVFKKIDFKLSYRMEGHLINNIKGYGYWIIDSEVNGYDKDLQSMYTLGMVNPNALVSISIRSIIKYVENDDDTRRKLFLDKIAEELDISQVGKHTD